MASTRWRRSCDASRADPLANTAARLPPDPPPNGAVAVSPMWTLMSSRATPSSSATTWATVVSTLWPLLIALVITSTEPLGPMRTVVASLDIEPNAVEVGSHTMLMPMPTRRPSSRQTFCCSRNAS